MAFLKEKDQEQLKRMFAALTGDVTLVNFSQEHECAYCRETRTLLGEVAALSDRIALESRDFVRDAEEVARYRIVRIPATVILGPGRQDHGIRLYGIPAGYEFTTLIEDILDLGGAGQPVSRQTAEALASLARPVHIQVFVTPTCPYCPAAVRTAHRLATVSDRITADMVEVQEFPELAVKYQVSGVPKIVINETIDFVGAQPEAEFVRQIVKAASA